MACMNYKNKSEHKEYTRKGNVTVIKHLDEVLKNELTAINHYSLHSKMFKDRRYTMHGDYVYKGSLDLLQQYNKHVQRR